MRLINWIRDFFLTLYGRKLAEEILMPVMVTGKRTGKLRSIDSARLDYISPQLAYRFKRMKVYEAATSGSSGCRVRIFLERDRGRWAPVAALKTEAWNPSRVIFYLYDESGDGKSLMPYRLTQALETSGFEAVDMVSCLAKA